MLDLKVEFRSSLPKSPLLLEGEEAKGVNGGSRSIFFQRLRLGGSSNPGREWPVFATPFASLWALRSLSFCFRRSRFRRLEALSPSPLLWQVLQGFHSPLAIGTFCINLTFSFFSARLWFLFCTFVWIQERRYLLKEFPELVSCKKCSKLLEVGCGNGSTALPILR